MTKEQFLQGVQFCSVNSGNVGATTYSYADNMISEQVRSSIDGRILIDQYCCNIIKIGSKGFSAFCFIMYKKVIVRYKFEDLRTYEYEVPPR